MNEIFLQNGKKIWLEAKSVRKFLITTNHRNMEIIRDENDNFKELKFSNLFSFKKGDKVVIKDKKSNNYFNFILNDISSLPNGKYEGIECKTNKSCIFILPFLGENYIYFDYPYSLYNVYVSEDYEYLYVKYKWTGSEDYLDLEEKLQTHERYMEFFDLNEEFVVFKFKIDKKYEKDVRAVIQGRYSKISEDLKLQILSFHGIGKSSKLGKVLFRDEEYRRNLELELGVKIPNDIDLMSKSTKEEEIWNYQSISQKTGMTN